MEAYITIFLTSRTLRQEWLPRYPPTTPPTRKTRPHKPYTPHTASSTPTTSPSGPWTGTLWATSSHPGATIASLASGPGRDPATQTTSTTGTTLARPPPKRKAHLTVARAGGKRWRKKSRKPKTKQRVWSIRKCHPATPAVRLFSLPASHCQVSAQRQTERRARCRASGVVLILRFRLHQLECHSHLNPASQARPCLPFPAAWIPRASPNSSLQAHCHLPPSHTTAVRSRLKMDPHLLSRLQISQASLRECRPVCRRFPQVCHHQASRASLLRLVVWVPCRRDGLALYLRLNRNSSKRNSNNNNNNNSSRLMQRFGEGRRYRTSKMRSRWRCRKVGIARQGNKKNSRSFVVVVVVVLGVTLLT